MTIVGLILIGLLAGIVSASLGVGGGMVFVPALVVLFEFDQHLAQGTSLAVIVPTTIIGAWVHARAGRVEWHAAIPIAVGGIAGGVLGAFTALALEPDVLRRMFAVLLAVTAARMLLNSRRVERSG